jgi:hypothetical protein
MSHVLSLLDKVDPGLPVGSDILEHDLDPENALELFDAPAREVTERWLQSLRFLIPRKVPVGALSGDKTPQDMASTVLKAHKNDKGKAIRYIQFVLNRGGRKMPLARKQKLAAAIDALQSM